MAEQPPEQYEEEVLPSIVMLNAGIKNTLRKGTTKREGESEEEGKVNNENRRKKVRGRRGNRGSEYL